jgi:DNA-binding HxlR family transcriptional regulator
MYEKGYGQFCPVAVASEIIGERWTLLVLRELISGSQRFNDIHRGVPLMSASLLAKRLRQLEASGLVELETSADGRAHSYKPTEATKALLPIIDGIGLWGLQHMTTTYRKQNLDPSFLIWDMRRHIRAEFLPPERTVILIQLDDARRAQQQYWLVKEKHGSDIDICYRDPGFVVDFEVHSDIKTMAMVWLGDLDVHHAVSTGAIRLDGPAALRTSFYDWIGLNPLAHMRVERGITRFVGDDPAA